MIEMKVDQRQLKQTLKKIESTAKTIRKAQMGVINDTTRNMRTKASAIMRETINVKKLGLDRRLKREFATESNLNGSINISDSTPIPLKYFGARQVKKGVKYSIIKPKAGGTVITVPGAFGPKIKRLGGNVYKRIGKPRTPLRKLPSVKITKEIRKTGVEKKVRRMVPGLLKKNMERRMDRALKSIERKVG